MKNGNIDAPRHLRALGYVAPGVAAVMTRATGVRHIYLIFREFLKQLYFRRSRNESQSKLEDVTCRGNEDTLPMKPIPN